MSPAAADSKNKGVARVLGTMTAGAAELMIFHPVDTVIKRLMNSKESVTSTTFSRILFQDRAAESWLVKYRSLFPGLGFGAAYKISQRVYKFGGQPYVKEFLNQRFEVTSKSGKTFVDASAGAMMGMGEVVLLPLDVLKIKAQTNEAFRSQGLSAVLKGESVSSLYAGWNWTMARNGPGSFALFGANAFVKEYVLGLEDHSKATFLQTTLSSTAGSVASIVVASPLDVVKTRVQSGTYGTDGGVAIIRNIVAHEGVGAFFKGSVVKVATIGPKLCFSFTVAQYLMSTIQTAMNRAPAPAAGAQPQAQAA